MKKIMVCLVAGLLLIGLVGCTNANGNLSTVPSPSPSSAVIIGTPSAMPGVSGSPLPSGTEAPVAPVLSTQESAALSKQCDTQIMKLSEVDQSASVLLGDKMLVGVTFTPQYKGTVTDRISDMIGERVKVVVSSVQDIKVTADTNLVARIRALQEKQQSGADTAEIESEFHSIENGLS